MSRCDSFYDILVNLLLEHREKCNTAYAIN